MATLQIDYDLTATDFSDIIDTAMMACSYWLADAEFYEPHDDGDPEAKLTVKSEDGEIAEVNQAKIEEAINKVLSGKLDVSPSICNDIRSAIVEDDYGYIDSYAADVLLQVACFGEVVYG